MVTGLFIQGLMAGLMLLSMLINNPNNIMRCTFTMVQSASVLGAELPVRGTTTNCRDGLTESLGSLTKANAKS